MKKNIHRHVKTRTLALKKETISSLTNGQLQAVAGGNTSGTVESRDPTLCYTK